MQQIKLGEKDEAEEENEKEDKSSKMEEDTDETDGTEEQEEEHPDEPLSIPEEFMFGVEEVNVDPKLLKFSKWTRKGRGGKRSKIFSLLRGRFVKAIFPKGKKSKLAVGGLPLFLPFHTLLHDTK